MSSKRSMVSLCLAVGAVIFLWCASILPRTTADLFASPDETAVMLFARAWSPGVGFRLPHLLKDDVAHLIGLHPRSMVRQGDVLVPVGFLGMPFLTMLAERVWNGSGAFLTALLVLSSAYPLWRLARRVNERVGWMSVLVYLSFPTVLLYANRGLFPNLPVVALGLWSVYAFQRVRSPWSVVSGATLGLALTIRPVEAMWLLPWIAWAIWAGRREHGTWNLKRLMTAGVVTTAVCLGGMWLAYQTYPGPHGWIPPVGYHLRDSILADISSSAVQRPEPAMSVVEWSYALPFGIHPRVAIHNTWKYFVVMLGPWFAAAALAVVIVVRRHRDMTTRAFLLVGCWTVGVLLLVYGQAFYTDNINATASLANSFLRYMLPLTPFVALGIAVLADAARSVPLRGTVLSMGLIIFFTLYGVAVGLNHDEESVLSTKRQLVRYVEIRRLADETLEPGTVILSERSDKIFASGDYASVSPLPVQETIDAVIRSSSTVALFHRTLTDPNAVPTSLSQYTLSDVFSVDNESMTLVGY